MAGEGVAGTRPTAWGEAWLGAVTEVGLVTGRRTVDGTENGLVAATDALTGHAVGSGAGTEVEGGVDVEAGVMGGAAAGF